MNSLDGVMSTVRMDMNDKGKMNDAPNASNQEQVIRRCKQKLFYNEEIAKAMVKGSRNSGSVQKSLEFIDPRKITNIASIERKFINGVFPSFPGEAWDRFFEGAGRVGSGDRVPLWMDLVVTGRCHCDCWHCFRSKYANKSDLPLPIIERVIQEAYQMGTVVVGITGGEPMLRKDILDILNYIPDGMEGRLYSTGFNMDEYFIKKASDTNLTGCNISIDHYLPKIINNRRNYKNAYIDAERSVRLLTDSNLYTTVTLCVTEDLCDEISIWNYIDFISNLGADEIRVTLPVPQGKLSGKEDKLLYLAARRMFLHFKARADLEETAPNIFLFSQLESQSFLGCGAGFHYISINNDGFVTPCVAIPLTFGNVYDIPFKTIYKSMSSYFKSSGSTCFGKLLNRLMMKENILSEKFPFPEELTNYLAPKCCVEGRNGRFFENLRKDNVCKSNVESSS